MILLEEKEILDEKYLELWNKCVPIRLGDLYQGMELGMCLDIIKELNNNCTLDEAKVIIESQGHSGPTASCSVRLRQCLSNSCMTFH